MPPTPANENNDIVANQYKCSHKITTTRVVPDTIYARYTPNQINTAAHRLYNMVCTEACAAVEGVNQVR